MIKIRVSDEIQFSRSEIISPALADWINKVPDFAKPLYWLKGSSTTPPWSTKITYFVLEVRGEERCLEVPSSRKHAIDFRNTKTEKHLLTFGDEFDLLKRITDSQIDFFTYNLENNNYPDFRGARFRTVQVHYCPLCGALSNEAYMGGSPGYGLRTRCPNIYEPWHKEVSKQFGSVWTGDHTEIVRPPNHKRVIRKFRESHRDEIKNDLFGNYDFALKDSAYYW